MKRPERGPVELVWVSDDEVLAVTMKLEQRDLKNRVKPLDSTSQAATDSPNKTTLLLRWYPSESRLQNCCSLIIRWGNSTFSCLMMLIMTPIPLTTVVTESYCSLTLRPLPFHVFCVYQPTFFKK